MPVLWWMAAMQGWACEPSPLQIRQMMPPDGAEGVPYNLQPVVVLGEGTGDALDYELRVEEQGGDEVDVLNTKPFRMEDGAPTQHVVLLTAVLNEDLAPDSAYRYWVEDDNGDVLGEAEFTTGPESLQIGIPDPAWLTLDAVGEPEAAETDCDYAESRLFELTLTTEWADVYDIGYVEIHLSDALGEFSATPFAILDVPADADASVSVPLRISTDEATTFCFRANSVLGSHWAPAPESVCFDEGFDTDYRLDPDYPANRGYPCGCGTGGGTSALALAAALALLRRRSRPGGA